MTRQNQFDQTFVPSGSVSPQLLSAQNSPRANTASLESRDKNDFAVVTMILP